VDTSDYAKQKLGDAKRAPATRPGAPEPTKERKLTAADLRSGKVMDSVTERLSHMQMP
jgi:hypothetical protein